MEENYTEIGQTSDIPSGTVKIYAYEDISIAICNVNGNFYAIENVCSHDEGPIGDGKLIGKNIECPRHGAQFDVTTGEITRMPAYGPIQTFPVKIEENKILIEIDD
ncbi:MAG: non-heme iron oxygenase ferredoxin subunit [bacterium]|nr:non-heme iron oxygenase ferredoxin subunit [bacterium]